MPRIDVVPDQLHRAGADFGPLVGDDLTAVAETVRRLAGSGMTTGDARVAAAHGELAAAWSASLQRSARAVTSTGSAISSAGAGYRAADRLDEGEPR